MCNDCHWGLTENDSLIERGPDSEKIRLWLRSEGSFPEHVYPVAIPTRLTSERLSIKGLGALPSRSSAPAMDFVNYIE
jgi:hypothetical protein